MTTYNLDIVAKDNASGVLKNIARQSDSVEKSVSSLKNALVGLATGAVATQILQIAKSFGDLDVRIRSVGTGSQTSQQKLEELTRVAAALGKPVTDVAEAFAQLKLAGIDSSESTLKTISKLATVGGADMGRTAELLGKALQGEFGKLDDYGIQVIKNYGQFEIKYQNKTQAIVRDAGSVVNEIAKIANTSAEFADAAEAKTKTISGSYGQLRGQLEAGIGMSGLSKEIAGVIKDFAEWEKATGAFKTTFEGLASVVSFVREWGSWFLWIGGAIASFTLFGRVLQGIRLAIGLLVDSGGALATVWTVAVNLFKNFGLTLKTLFGEGLATGLRVTLSFLDDIGKWIVSNAAPLGAVIGVIGSGVSKIIDKWNEWRGAKPTQLPQDEIERENKALSQKLKDREKALKENAKTTQIVAAQASEFTKNFFGGFTQAKNELSDLRSIFDSTMAALAKNPNNKLLQAEVIAAFDQMQQRAKTLGENIQPPMQVAALKFAQSFHDATESAKSDIAGLEEILRKGSLESILNPNVTGKVGDVVTVNAMGITQELAVVTQLIEAYAKLGKYKADLTAQQVILQSSLEVKSLENNRAALALIGQQYKDGEVTIREYTQAVMKLKDEYTAMPFAVILEQSKRQSALFADNRKNAELLREEVKKGSMSWMEYDAAVKAIGAEHLPEASAQLNVLKSDVQVVAETMRTSMFQATEQMSRDILKAVQSGQNAFGVFKNFLGNLFNEIVTQLIKKQLVDPIALALNGVINAAMASAGGGGGLMSFFGGMFGGGKALGGPVSAGTPYVVGERGPELFMPNSAGTIIPNDQLTTGNGKPMQDNQPLNVNFTINAIDTQTGIGFLLQNKPAIINMVSDAYNRRGRNGPLN